MGFRRAFFQIHLWLGVGVGLYVLLICLSGSAIVFRREMDRTFCPRIIMVSPSGPRLTNAELEAHARAAYRGFEPRQVEIRGPRTPGAATEVWYVGGTVTQERLFNPYTGEDLGDTVACEPRLVSSIAELHDRLLGGRNGLLVNGVGSIIVTLMCASGAVIWWTGIGSRQRRMTLRRGVGWRRFVLDLHNMLGFWLFLFVVLWALTGIYFGFPLLFQSLGDETIAFLVRLHFGRSFGFPVKVVWAILGLVPCVLFITGVVMWWNRVVRRRA
jgi:uncharacterized iron-regulated membrane protein